MFHQSPPKRRRDNTKRISEVMDPEELDKIIEGLVNEKCDKHAAEQREKTAAAWSFTPQTISGYIAIGTIILGAMWTFSDFRVTLNDMTTRQTNLTERINQIDRRVDELDRGGSRPMVVLEQRIKILSDQFDEVHDALESVNGAIRQHNEAEYEMWRKVNPGKTLPSPHAVDPIVVPPGGRRRLDLIKPGDSKVGSSPFPEKDATRGD